MKDNHKIWLLGRREGQSLEGHPDQILQEKWKQYYHHYKTMDYFEFKIWKQGFILGRGEKRK